MSELVSTHAVLRRDLVSGAVEEHAEELRRVGVTIIPGAFTRDEMEYARKRLHEIYASQVDEIGGEENLHRINDANIVRCPLAYDDFFVSIAKHPTALAVARAALGPKITLASQVGILNKPASKNYVENWHRELQYQHLTTSRPLAVQTLLTVDDFTPDNGATFFLYGSHLFENFPSDAFVRKWQVQIQAPAGSLIMFDSLLYHRSSPNRTDRERLAINNFYTLPILAQQIDLASMLNGAHSETEEDRELFGYQWNPPPSVIDWRRQKLGMKPKG
jgi:ectoine hydroxylase-related dioxygenase (phytanoyl-CoA dioxygenase family)